MSDYLQGQFAALKRMVGEQWIKQAAFRFSGSSCDDDIRIDEVPGRYPMISSSNAEWTEVSVEEFVNYCFDELSNGKIPQHHKLSIDGESFFVSWSDAEEVKRRLRRYSKVSLFDEAVVEEWELVKDFSPRYRFFRRSNGDTAIELCSPFFATPEMHQFKLARGATLQKGPCPEQWLLHCDNGDIVTLDIQAAQWLAVEFGVSL